MLQKRVIVDREGMAAPFLRDLQAGGTTVVTLLRTDQYKDLSSFTEVGAFTPLSYSREGQLLREVAPACFALPLPDQPGQMLPLQVALIRDWRKPVARQMTEEEEERAEERASKKPSVWHANWKAEPTPAAPSTAKLIPIVTTAQVADAVELAQTYTRCWEVAGERDQGFLTALGFGYQSRIWQGVNYKISWLMATLDTGGEVEGSISGRLLHNPFKGGRARLFGCFSP